MAWNPKKTIAEARKGDLRTPTPSEVMGKGGAPGWSPAQTTQEIKEDPYRAGRLAASTAATGGIPVTELMTGYEKTTGKKLTSGWYPKTPKTAAQAFGTNPTINPADILGDGGGGAGGAGGVGSNPYASAAELAIGQAGRPDFSAATATAAKQAELAQALQGLYGTGSSALTGLIGDLQSQAKGDFGPRGSLGQALLNQGLQQNIAGVRSQLASQRGLSPALAARYAAQQTAQLGGQTAQQAGILGLQQQIAAQEQLGKLGMGAAELGAGTGGQLMTQGRQQDITQATANVDADLKKLQILSSNDVELKKLAGQTGLGEKEIKMKIALANQAAAMGDRKQAIQIIGGIFGAAAKGIAMGATGGASGAGEAAGGAAGGSDTGIMAGSPYENMNRMAAHGGRIDGHASVEGDDYRNDTVPAMLSPGEIVIPRTAARDKTKAKQFLDALDGWDEKPSYAKVLKARRAK